MSYRISRRRLQVAPLVLIALLALSGVAAAASGPKLLKPSKNAVIAVGSRPTFSVSDHSQAAKTYHVWLTVASVKKVKHGELQQDITHGDFARMKRKQGGKYSYRPPSHTFPDWYLQRPGKYYWQTYHIDCSTTARHCHILSKIRSFTVQ